MRAHHVRRPVVALAVLLLAATLAVLAPGPTAHADVVTDWLGKVNGLRSSLGLVPLQLDAEESALAQRRAEINAQNDVLAHEPDLTAGVTENWVKLGENVGTGPSVDPIWDAFVHSPKHYANLADPAFTHIGIGVAYNGAKQYVTHRFLALAPAGPPAAGGGGSGGSGSSISSGTGGAPRAPVTTAPRPTTTVTTAPPPAPTTSEPVPATDAVASPAVAAPASVGALLDALHRLDR